MITPAGSGQVNWTGKVVTFTGDGAPNLEGKGKALNAAQARIGAERAAKLNALRQAVETVKGIRVDAGGTAGDKMNANPQTSAAVEGVVKNWTVVDIRYYSDGGVQVDVKVPLDGILTQALLRSDTINLDNIPKPTQPGQAAAATPPAGSPSVPAQPAGTVATTVTGLVILAQNLDIQPVVAPKILDPDGKPVYDATMVNKTLENGVAAYVKDEKSAREHKTVAGNPLVIPAVKTANGFDLTVSADDAVKIRQLVQMNEALKQGRVVIVKK